MLREKHPMEIIEKIDERLSKLKYDYLDLNSLNKLEFPYNWVFYLYFERYFVLLTTCKNLLEEYKIYPHYDMPVGLLLRTMILDSLTIVEILSQIEDVKEPNNNINKLLVDNLIRFFDSNESLNDEINEKFKKEFELKFGIILKQLNVSSVDGLIENRKTFHYKTAKQIYNSIKVSKYKKLAYGYELYLYYSKYEHFGLLYPIISRISKDTKTHFLNESFDFIFHVIDQLIDSVEN